MWVPCSYALISNKQGTLKGCPYDYVVPARFGYDEKSERSNLRPRSWSL